ncbi:CsgG/HfaB family protein [Orbus sturtevantii]|uniref:CsgG/HfaB family protein n=1 Tax=Orbus sturtevantii TaxID=3074109 RepID=UPI00370D226E
MKFNKKNILCSIFLPVVLLTGCATESSRVIEVNKTKSYSTNYQGVKSPIAIGKFENRSNYQNGLFSDGVDRLGNQTKTVLISHLQQTGRFTVLDRSNLQELKNESKISAKNQSLIGARYIITGNITEFGRKEVGDNQLWGILGRGKTQVAYAKVIINVIDVKTSAVVYTAPGAGEYSLSNREIIGFGGKASYDATLNDKVIDLAINEAVSDLISGIQSGAWNPTK